MRFSKIISVIQAIDKKSIERLDDYLHSPYFKVPAGAVDLFDHLKNQHTNKDYKEIEEETITQKIPALNTRNKQDIAAARLFNAIENFLFHEKVQKNKYIQTQCRLSVYKELHLFELFDHEYSEALKDIDKNSEQDFEVFYQRHLFIELAFSGFDATLNRTAQNDLYPVINTLDEFYALKKIRYQCEALNRHRVIGTPYKEENISNLIEIIERFSKIPNSYPFLFINVYNMLKSKTFDESFIYYEILVESISKIELTVLPQGLKDVIRYITNNSQFWFNQGYKQAGVAALACQELKMTHKILIKNGKIQPSDFRNIISLAIANGRDSNWVKEFIDTYSKLLPTEHAEINKVFSLAQYNYYVQKYEDAMPLFQQARVKDEPVFNIIVRRWQFMCLYQQDPSDISLLLSFLDAFEKYIQRNPANIHQHKETFIKNIDYSRKLIKASNNSLIKQLKEQLVKESYFVGKDWILRQLP